MIRYGKSTCIEQTDQERHDLRGIIMQHTVHNKVTCEEHSSMSTFAAMLDKEVCIQWAQNKNRGPAPKPNITDTTWHLYQHINHHSTLIHIDKCTFTYACISNYI